MNKEEIKEVKRVFSQVESLFLSSFEWELSSVSGDLKDSLRNELAKMRNELCDILEKNGVKHVH